MGKRGLAASADTGEGAAKVTKSDSAASASTTVAQQEAKPDSSAGSPPVHKPLLPESGATSWLPLTAGKKWPKPVLPPDEEVRVARDVMQEVIPWVLQELPTYMQSAGCWDVRTLCLTKCAPLKIAPPSLGKEDKKNMKSYKEAWVLANCGKSVGESKMYEAGGNMLWLNPEVWCEKFIPGPEPSWAWVVECANRNFHVAGKVVDGSVRDRIMFPIPLAGAWCRDVGELVKGFPIGMKPLGSHGFLYGWHLAVLRAMEANDKRRVEMLCEAALTATTTLYAECDKPTLLMHAMHFLRLFAIPLLRWWTPSSHLLGSAMR